MSDEPDFTDDAGHSDHYAVVRCPACGHSYIELSDKCPRCGHWGHARQPRSRWLWWLALLVLISFVIWAVR